MKLPKLPKWSTIVGGAMIVIPILNQNWGAITSIPGIHVPQSVTSLVQLAGALVTMFGHSLGTAPDLAPKEGLESGREAMRTLADNAATNAPPASAGPDDAPLTAQDVQGVRLPSDGGNQ